MNWRKSSDILPPLNKSTRCLAYICHGPSEDTQWSGFVDVYFSPFEGWRRCETQESVYVLKWIPIDEIFKEDFEK